MRSKTFTQTGEFAAVTAAEDYLRERGFSIGSMQGDAPRGIRFGDCSISKWRGLSTTDIRSMHGAMTGNGRFGPVTIELFDAAPAAAIEAFSGTAQAVAECI